VGDNIEMDSKEIEWEGFDWVNLSQDRYRRALLDGVGWMEF